MQPQSQSEGGNKMQIQLTTDYAIRILTYLALKKAVASSTELSIKLAIPQKYVARVGYKLKNADLADTVTGSLGGYILARPVEDISLYDIIGALEDGVKINRCLEDERLCGRNATSFCVVHDFFHELQSTIDEKLKSETLATLLQRRKHVNHSRGKLVI